MYQTAGGTATAITLTGVVLEDGHPKTFIASSANGAVATTINTKPLYKPGGTIAPNLVAGKAYTVWYNVSGACFFIKASAEGDAVAGDVLAGKKFSNDNDTGLAGGMPNNGVFSLGLGVSVPTGYYSGGTTANGKRWATGGPISSNSSSQLVVSGLSFTPSLVSSAKTTSGASLNRAIYVNKSLLPGALYDTDLYTDISGVTNPGTTTVGAGTFTQKVGSASTANYVWTAYE